MSGSGRPPPPDYGMASVAMHRRAALLALMDRAHRDDEKRAAAERELKELDEAIARGMESLAEERRRELLEHYKKNHPEILALKK